MLHAIVTKDVDAACSSDKLDAMRWDRFCLPFGNRAGHNGTFVVFFLDNYLSYFVGGFKPYALVMGKVESSTVASYPAKT